MSALEAIVAARYPVAAVYTQPDRPAGRGRTLTASPVKRCALALGLPVLQPVTLKDRDAAATLAAFLPEVMVVAAYGLLLPPAVLAVPRLGCLNIHASLLPRWRGAAPVQRAILAGDATTGTSIMRMEAGLDTGPVYATETLPIGPRDTAAMLTAALARQGAGALLALLERLAAGLTARAQAVEGVTYARKLEKAEARIDWGRPAQELDRQVRAFQPWPVAETRWQGAQLRIHEAEPRRAGANAAPGTILTATADGIEVATGEGVLVLTRLQLAGRNVVSARDFIQSETRRGPLAGCILGEAA